MADDTTDKPSPKEPAVRFSRRKTSDTSDTTETEEFLVTRQSRDVGKDDITDEEYDEMSMSNKRLLICGGALDIALFTTNIDQMKFVIETRHYDNNYFAFVITMLGISLFLQFLCGILMFAMGFMNVKKKNKKRDHLINQTILCLVALIMLVNIIITAFGNRTTAIAQYCFTT